MKLRITTTIITLSFVLGLAMWNEGRSVRAKTAAAPAMAASYPLNPNQFVSLGASPFNAAGTYTIDASKDNAAPILTKPDSTTITGVFYSPSNGAVARDEIAVFTFNSLTIPADVTVQGARTGNSRPIALLSQSTITIDGTIDVSGANGTNGTSEFDPLGGTGGNGGNAGPGGGGGAGGAGRNSSAGVGFEGGASGSSQSGGGSVVAGGGGNNGVSNFSGGGGAFGGNGGNGFANVFGLGGTAYGDLALRLQGGSGGGGGGISITPGSCDPDDGCGPSTTHGGGGGGGGGGAVELGAVGNLTLNGNVLANGGAGGVNLSGHSGGAGAGGGIFLHAVTVALSGNLNARGGNVNGFSVTNGGGGGGGRVQILTANGMLSSGSLTTNVNVSGGTGNQAGGGGVKELTGPTQVAFAQQPTNTGPNTAISPAITVQVQDAQGRLLTTSTAPVTLALSNNPGGATLGGTLTVNAVGGIATFNNITVSKPAFGYTLVATSGSLTSATSAAFNISCQPITILPGIGTLPTGTTGTSYSLQFTQRDGVGPITWSVSPPVPGLSIDANGLFSGIPTQSGGFLITVTATDGKGCPGSTSYNLSITCPAISLPSISLATGTYNSPYPATELIPTGGTAPYQFTVTGLPNGMQATATSTKVTLSGTPAQSGAFTVAVRVQDTSGCANGANGQSYSLRIDKATPTIIWNNPADINYGTALSVTQLNAMANAPGTYSYSPANGTVLNAGSGQTLTVMFMPTDNDNYLPSSQSVQINVLKALPVLNWANPADIVYGMALGAAQLNATANVPGDFAYMPASGTVLNAGNGQTLTVTFTPQDTGNYTSASKQVLINVLKATPLLAWASPAYLSPGPLTAAVLNATASVPGSFSYTPALGALLTAGTQALRVDFIPQDAGNYLPVSLQTQLPVAPRCANLANGTLQVTAQGGNAPLQYSINGGASFAPTNVFNSLTAGTYAVVVKDARGALTAPQNITLTQPAALSLSPASLSASVVGQPFSQVFTVNGGTGAQSVTVEGQLPNWLNFTPATATLSGSAPAPATISFALVVTDQAGCTARFNYTLNFNCPSLTLAPVTLANGVQGAVYNQTIAASPAGTTYSYAVATGTLPPGLTLASNGALTGTPTAGGNYAFAVKVTGWGGCTQTQSYSLLITGTCSTITVNPATLQAGALGSAYAQTVSAVGGAAPYSYSVVLGALPAGLTLNSSTGELTGTPTASGLFSFTIRATGQGGCGGQRAYVLSIGCGALSFAPASLPNGMARTAYQQQLSVNSSSSATFSLSLGSLPPGFSLNSSGLLSGTTSQANTYNFTLKAVVGTCQVTKAYTLVIGAGSNSVALAISGDYDGDGSADPALWSAKDGMWQFTRSSDGQIVAQRWGQTGDVTLLGDYDGDGKSDLAVFRSREATFYIKRSSDGGTISKAWGLPTDVPVPGDYDGDGQTDIAVWRGAEGNWYITQSSDGQTIVQAWGASYAPYFDVPVAGDYDGDGKSDLAVFRKGNGTWFIKRSRDGQMMAKLWGLGSDTPVAADYDGDGMTDIAVWRGGIWYLWLSATSRTRIVEWGTSAAPYYDQVLPGDYDGDGLADQAVWRASEHAWYMQCSRVGLRVSQVSGQLGDRPVGVLR